MRLTTQMRAEAGTIESEVHRITQGYYQAAMAVSRYDRLACVDFRISYAVMAELNSHRVRLENIFCETDLKEQAHSHLSQLVAIYACILW